MVRENLLIVLDRVRFDVFLAVDAGRFAGSSQASAASATVTEIGVGGTSPTDDVAADDSARYQNGGKRKSGDGRAKTAWRRRAEVRRGRADRVLTTPQQ